MDKAALEKQVKELVAEQLGVDQAQCTPDASFTEDLGADSLDQVELVMAFEEEFNMEIQDVEAEGLTTIQKAVDYIEQKLSGRPE